MWLFCIFDGSIINHYFQCSSILWHVMHVNSLFKIVSLLVESMTVQRHNSKHCRIRVYIGHGCQSTHECMPMMIISFASSPHSVMVHYIRHSQSTQVVRIVSNVLLLLEITFVATKSSFLHFKCNVCQMIEYDCWINYGNFDWLFIDNRILWYCITIARVIDSHNEHSYNGLLKKSSM